MRTSGVQSHAAPITKTASSTSVQTLLAANASRLGLAIFNDSTAILTVKLGPNAASGDLTLKIAGGGLWECPFNYVGIVTGLWATANGNAYVTEYV